MKLTREGGGFSLLASIAVLTAICTVTESSHFRGGTISWRPVTGTQVEFTFKLGWTFSNGPGCIPSKVGQFVNGMSDSWNCVSGCGPNPKFLSTTNYVCSGANRKANWEQGQHSFKHKFPNNGPFTVSYTGQAWIKTSDGKGNAGWNIQTVVDLRKRSDTGAINSSPISLSKPMYYTQFKCELVLRIPVIDPDGDTVRCRWAKGKECVSICNGLPGAVLDEEKCTLSFTTTALNKYAPNGIYGVALTIEDYPKKKMSMGARQVTPMDAISSIPLQFLVKTISSVGSCDDVPRFIPPTPEENDVITVEEGKTVTVDLVADNGNDTSTKVATIEAAGVVGIKQTPIEPVNGTVNTFHSIMTWPTKIGDIGEYIVCASVENVKKKTGDDRCFKIKVVPAGCVGNPCVNGGKCQSNNGSFTCTCRPGYTGKHCEIDPVGKVHPKLLTTVVTVPVLNTTTPPKSWCPLKYGCRCVFTSYHRRVYFGWAALSRVLRDILSFVFGFPFGLLLSCIFYWCCVRCARHCMRDDHVRYRPQSKPVKK